MSLRTSLCLAVLFLAILPSNSASSALQADPGICSAWTQVNEDAFGLPSGMNFAAEEGFEVLVFDGQLYVGMEADNELGARLWRTRSGVPVARNQADWEEVIADAAGLPFGVANITQNDHIDSLAEFGGYLYVSTANGGSSTLGIRVFRSATAAPFAASPDAWEDAIAAYGAGFGDPNNVNFKDMQIFDGWLCGGTQNVVTGAQVWCTQDGLTWLQKNRGGFGLSADDPAVVEVWSGHVFAGALYFGVQSADDSARLYRTSSLVDTPATWELIYNGPAGSRRVDILGDLDGYLYISTRSPAGIVIFRSPNGDAGSWQQVNQAGMDGNPANAGAVVDSATIHDRALYVGVFNLESGFEVWRTRGLLQGNGLVDWVQVGASGLGDSNNLYTELIPFNGYLYAWTSNYVTGQQVLRSDCDPVDHSQNHMLRFYGHGVDDIDRVKIKIDDPAVPADVGDSFTLEWWMKAATADNDSNACASGNDNWITGNIIFDRDVWGTGDYGDWGVSLHGGVIAFGVHNGTDGAGICGATDVADNAWHHVAITRNGIDGQLSIYVDGVLDSQGSGPNGDLSYRNGRSTSYAADPFLVIGAEKHDAGSDYPSYSGYLDDIRLSNIVRYSSNFSRPERPFISDGNTVALYHLDEGNGDVINDSAGAAGGPGAGLRRYGGSAPAGPEWLISTAPIGAAPLEPVQPMPDIARSDNDLRLAWLHDARNSRYELWRSSTPHFTPGDSGSEKIGEILAPLSPNIEVIFVDGGAGDTAGNRFYSIRSLNVSGVGSPPSSQVGKFDFPLVAGGS